MKTRTAHFAFLIVFCFAAVSALVSTSLAAKPAGGAPAPDAAAATSTVPAEAVPAGLKPVDKSSDKPVEVDPEDLIAKVAGAYGDIKQFTVTLTVSQDMPNKKINEDRIHKIESRYLIKYKVTGDPESGEYLMRLQGEKGFNDRTTVIYAPAKSGEYVYRVYKPAIPKGSTLKSGNALMEDVPQTLPMNAVRDMLSVASDPGAVKKAYYNPKMDRLTLEITSGKMGKVVRAGGVPMPFKIISHFDPVTFFILEQETRVQMKKDGEYLFRSRLKWIDFDPRAKLTREDITAVPRF